MGFHKKKDPNKIPSKSSSKSCGHSSYSESSRYTAYAGTSNECVIVNCWCYDCKSGFTRYE